MSHNPSMVTNSEPLADSRPLDLWEQLPPKQLKLRDPSAAENANKSVAHDLVPRNMNREQHGDYGHMLQYSDKPGTAPDYFGLALLILSRGVFHSGPLPFTDCTPRYFLSVLACKGDANLLRRNLRSSLDKCHRPQHRDPDQAGFVVASYLRPRCTPNACALQASVALSVKSLPPGEVRRISPTTHKFESHKFSATTHAGTKPGARTSCQSSAQDYNGGQQ